MAGMRRCSRSGSGRRSTRRSPRFWRTSIMSPTDSIFVATSRSGRGSRRRSLCRRFRAPDASDAVRVVVRRAPGPSRLVAREPPPSFTPLRSRGVFIFFPRVGFVFFVSFGFHREHARSEGGQREEALQRGVDVARRAEILQPRGLRSRPPRERPGVVPHRASNERVQVLLPQPGPAPRADGRDEAADAVASTSAALTIRRARMTIVAHRGQRRGASGVGEEEPQRARVVQVAPERAPTQLRQLRRVVRGARRGRAGARLLPPLAPRQP